MRGKFFFKRIIKNEYPIFKTYANFIHLNLKKKKSFKEKKLKSKKLLLEKGLV